MLRRLARLLLSLLAVASLVPCLATCGLWVRSYWHGEAYNFHDSERWYSGLANCGQFVGLTWKRVPRDETIWTEGREELPAYPESHWDRTSLPWQFWFAGVGYGDDPRTVSPNIYLVFPLGYLAGLTAVPPA